MRHIFVRPARVDDRDKFVEFTTKTPNNLADPDVLTYKNSSVRCAFNQDGPIVFLPIQRPLMMEALAINPEANEFDVAGALKELTQDVVTKAYEEGSGEIYFLCKDELTCKFAAKQCFTELPYKLFRLKLKDLECPPKPSAESSMNPSTS